MSPRAAWRLERLGYGPVSDYVAGKMDWLSFNLPSEGHAELAGSHLHTDVPTCRLDEAAGAAASRYEDRDGSCVVVNDAGVVMGVADLAALRRARDEAVEQVAVFGVTTVRPSEEAEALAVRMRRADVSSIIVTNSDGVLLGVFTPAGG